MADQNIYDDYNIVEEKAIYLKSTSKFRESSQFAFLEFQIGLEAQALSIKDLNNVQPTNVALAEIVLWEWNVVGKQEIKRGSTLLIYGDIGSSTCLIVRILKEREVVENPCPSLISPDDDFTIQIGNQQMTVSAHWFMAVSPKISNLISGIAIGQRWIDLENYLPSVDIDQFIGFLQFISMEGLGMPILPNSTIIHGLLDFADHFRLEWLKRRCETHLMNAVEMELIDRVLLANDYKLNNFKDFVLRLELNVFRAFFNANKDVLSNNAQELHDEMVGRSV